MDDLRWVTTPLTGPALAAALALLDRSGAVIPSPATGSVRRHVGAVDVDQGTLGAVAVVDLDGSGTAHLRAVAGDARRLAGLTDLLRAGGALRVVAGAPLDDGWHRTGIDPPTWQLDL